MPGRNCCIPQCSSSDDLFYKQQAIAFLQIPTIKSPVWKGCPIWGRSSGCRVDLGRVHRVQGRSGPCAPGAMSLMPYASGCNTLHALYIRVQCPAFMPCTSGCMDEREYIYAIAPRTHDQSSLCLCAWPLHLHLCVCSSTNRPVLNTFTGFWNRYWLIKFRQVS